MNTNGNLERNLTIESMYDIDAMSSNVYALIGEPFNFETPTSFNSAKITFKIDKTKLGDTKFDNLLILWYNEEEQIFEEMETLHDEANSTVSTTTTHFSQYMIVDSEKWFANWETSFNELRKMWDGGTSYYKSMNTIFIIDCSEGVDPENNRLAICQNILNNMKQNDQAAAITYSYGVRYSIGFHDPQAISECLERNINNFGPSTGLVAAFNSAMYMVYNSSADMNRIVILTTHNSRFAPDSSWDSNWDLSNVCVNVVDLSDGAEGMSLAKLTQRTGGGYYRTATADALTYQHGDEVYIPPQFIGKDSDGDGIPDLVEECGLLPNGQPLGTSSLLKDTDGDGIPDNEEFNISMDKLTYEINKEQYVNAIYAKSHPNEIDTDGDKLWDNCDPKPQNKHNNGESLELSSGNDGTIAQLQHWLVALGYLNMHDNPYGQNYGPITRTAVYIYQMNHGFQSTVITNGKETAIKNIDDLTYATIANDFANNFGNGEEDYLNYVEGISDKPYFNSIETTCPTVSEAQSACGVKVIKKDNSTIKANYANTFDLYFYDYTEPLNTKMNENLLYLLHLSYLYENTETESSIASMMAVEFFNNVKPYGDWDYKIQTSWEKAFKDIPYMSISFPFILRENFCSAEKFGNVNYGYVGKAIGFSEDILINFGHVVSLVTSKQFEGEDDLNNVRKGFEYYDKDVK